ncbi:MAG TPA: LPS assembly protein LptD [Candidatus Acidoferrales bacterium]|nr:LPS assembly protein LptD [Candidatus Acidoferrales bacterium]
MPIAKDPQRLGGWAYVPALLLLIFVFPSAVRAQSGTQPCNYQKTKARESGVAWLWADKQGAQTGETYFADGCVDIQYQDARLRADHVEWNETTDVITATGHVQLDYQTQHVEADDARYELRTGRGVFHNVRATFALQRRPQPTLLVSPNPLSFRAKEAERLDKNSYRIRGAWLTVCNPDRPVWKFYAPMVTVRLHDSVHLENGNFRVFSVPILYLPYATFPSEKRRNSGLLVPSFGQSSIKGYTAGDEFYWAPVDWFDLSAGGNYFSARGWSQAAELRMKPWTNTSLDASYFGVIDRGVETPGGALLKQGGHEMHLLFTADLPRGWRAVADLDQLSSLTFRLAWSENFTQAVNSEVRNTAFLSKNYDGFSINFAELSYQNFLTATPATSITLRTAPEVRMSSVDRPLFGRLPIYYSLEGFSGAENRSESATGFTTPRFVERSEFAPSVEMPLRWGPWLNVTPSFTFRSTFYGGQMQNGAYLADSFSRNTEEFSLDVRPPAFERMWGGDESKWKHAIEPDVTYSYVTGVNDFGRFVRFDEDETLTDTNEVEYGVTQRLFHRTGEGGGHEVMAWKVAQKYFFDPTFGGALAPGQRNAFQTLDSLSPFAFADEPRRFSPIVSEVTIEPGRRYDTQFILNYDPQRNRTTAIGTLLKVKPYKESFLTMAQFSTLNLPLNPSPPPPNFEQRSNQIRVLAGYGDLTRRGWNATFGASYDVSHQEFQNQIAEFSYNGSCCGIGFEYRRFSFGRIRNENQYMLVFRIANLGSAGNLRREEKLF